MDVNECRRIPRPVARRRAEALARAIQAIETEFECVGQMIMQEGRLPIEVPLKDAVLHGFPEAALANDVTLAPWEILMVLKLLHDRYVAEVLGPSEAA